MTKKSKTIWIVTCHLGDHFKTLILFSFCLFAFPTFALTVGTYVLLPIATSRTFVLHCTWHRRTNSWSVTRNYTEFHISTRRNTAYHNEMRCRNVWMITSHTDKIELMTWQKGKEKNQFIRTIWLNNEKNYRNRCHYF